MSTVNAAEIQDYFARDWGLIERVKTDQWIAQKGAMTPSAVFELAGELLEYASALRPDWPNFTERQADLDAHIRLAEMLQRACQNRAR